MDSQLNAVSMSARQVDVRTAYLSQAAISYSIYLVGASSAFIAVALSLSDTEAGLHSSAMALGLIGAGIAGERIESAIGERVSQVASLGMLGVALLVLAWSPSMAATLVAALVIGIGAGLMFGHVNQTLGAAGGTTARVQITRSALVAKAVQLVVPMAIGIGIAIGLEWRFVVMPVLVVVAILFVLLRSSGNRDTGPPRAMARLPWAYWVPWMLTVSVIAIEFFVVVWGGTLVARQTGATLADATLTISAFLAGLIIGRVAMSIRVLGQLDPILVIRAGILLTIVAVLVPWLSGSYEISAIGMLVAGFGVGILYPMCASIALAAAPDQPAAASARLVLAAGLAILVAPLLLGVLADVAGITAGWFVVPALCVGALALSAPVARSMRSRGASVA